MLQKPPYTMAVNPLSLVATSQSESDKFPRALGALRKNYGRDPAEPQAYALLDHILARYVSVAVHSNTMSFVNNPQYKIQGGISDVIPDFGEVLLSDNGLRVLGWWWEAKKSLFPSDALGTEGETVENDDPSVDNQFRDTFPQLWNQALHAFEAHSDINVFHSFWSAGEDFVFIRWLRRGHEGDQTWPWPVPTASDWHTRRYNAGNTEHLSGSPPPKRRRVTVPTVSAAKRELIGDMLVEESVNKLDHGTIIPRMIYYLMPMFTGGEGAASELSPYLLKALRMASEAAHLQLSFLPSMFDPPDNDEHSRPNSELMDQGQKNLVYACKYMIQKHREPALLEQLDDQNPYVEPSSDDNYLPRSSSPPSEY
ncbi:hypothetical protein BC834DRAFT_896971 [Gloeopeniophorella convolvens]|nr:hypothetical protein BC834DRAFT_896971 [Gloeopeniophorella convolvens]